MRNLDRTIGSAILSALALGAIGGISVARAEPYAVPERARIPMYGQPNVVPSPAQKRIDDEYVESMLNLCDQDRHAATFAPWSLAERLLADGKIDEAMARYNEAWLVDPKSHAPYWGFGRVLMRRQDATGAIRYLERARDLCGTNPALLADLGTAYSMAGSSGASSPYVARADSQFAASLRADSLFAAGWIAWARADCRAGRIREAQWKIDRAEALGARVPGPLLYEVRRNARADGKTGQ